MCICICLLFIVTNAVTETKDYSTENCSWGKVIYEKHGYEQYIVEEPFVSVFLPSKYLVFWRGVPANAESLRKTGQSVEVYNQLFRENPSTLLFADDAASDTSYMITMQDFYTADFSSVSVNLLENYIHAVYYPQGLAEGDKNNKYKIRSGQGYCYVECMFENAYIGGPYNLTAFTVINNKMISLMYMSGRPISDSDKAVFDEVLGSMVMSTDQYPQSSLSELDVDVDSSEELFCEYGDGVFQIPASLIIIDRETKQDNLLLNAMGISIDQARSLLNEQNLELYAYTYDNSYNITLRINQIDGQDFTYDHKTYVTQTHKELTSMYASMGNIVESTVVEGNFYPRAGGIEKQIWLKDRVFVSSQGADVIVYTTICNNMQYTFSVSSRTLTDKVIKMMDTIITSSDLC